MIEIRDLTVVMGRTTALKDVSFTIERGEIIGLIGPPESGKSILLKAIAALVDPSRGNLCCDRKSVANLGERERQLWQSRIGMSFQNDALFDSFSVFDNVAFPLRETRVGEVEVKLRVDRALEDVSLGNAASRFPSEISGGMRKRVGIARATVIDPEFGLFDDPTAGLDPASSESILELIVNQAKRLGNATVVVSNDLPVLFPICDRVVMLNCGEVLYDGSVANILDSGRSDVTQFVTGSDSGPL